MWSLLCIPPLVAMVESDLRSRRIGVAHLLILGITLLAASMIEFGWWQMLSNLILNLSATIFLWLMLYVYALLREMRLSEMMGGGDLAFVLAVTPYFGIVDFVTYLIVSSLLTLAAWWVSGVITTKRSRDIPLVTGLGTCLGAVILYRTIMF